MWQARSGWYRCHRANGPPAAVRLPFFPDRQPPHRFRRTGGRRKPVRSPAQPRTGRRRIRSAYLTAVDAESFSEFCHVTTHAVGDLGRQAEHPNARGLTGFRPHREQQPVQFWNEERRPRSENRRNVRDVLVCAPLSVEHIEEPLAAADIDAVAFRVDEKVVSIPADVQTGQRARRLRSRMRRASRGCEKR